MQAHVDESARETVSDVYACGACWKMDDWMITACKAHQLVDLRRHIIFHASFTAINTTRRGDQYVAVSRHFASR